MIGVPVAASSRSIWLPSVKRVSVRTGIFQSGHRLRRHPIPGLPLGEKSVCERHRDRCIVYEETG